VPTVNAAVDLAKEIKERRNSRHRQAYAARVVAKVAVSAQEDADRVTVEAAANWRRLRQAETARDRYQKQKIANNAACPSGPTESSLSSSSSGTLTIL
jgi:hypothetical protein